MSGFKVNFSVNNQLATPSIHAAPFAQRPAAGQPGRVFIDTDSPSTGIYRDTGSTWIQIAGTGGGGGTLQTVTDAGNTTTNDVAIGTNSNPSAPLDVHGAGVVAILQGTGTNDSFLQYNKGGSGKFKVGNVHNAGNDYYTVYNLQENSDAILVNISTNNVAIGGGTVSPSYKLDITGSLRNTGNAYFGTSSGNVGIGTDTNDTTVNYTSLTIKGSSGSYISLRNSTTQIFRLENNGTSLGVDFKVITNSPLIFSNNNTERARFQPTGNFLIGTTTDAGYKLDVNGATRAGGFTLGNTATNKTTAIFTNNFTSASSVNFQWVGYRTANSSSWQDTALGLNLLVDTTDLGVKAWITTAGTFNAAGGYSTTNGAFSAGYDTFGGAFKNVNAGGTATSLPTIAGSFAMQGTSSANISNYGVYINNTSTVSGTGRKWGLYSAAGTNYLNDNVLIGTTTDAGYKLDVNGTARVQGLLEIVNSTSSTVSKFTNGQLVLDGSTTLPNKLNVKGGVLFESGSGGNYLSINYNAAGSVPPVGTYLGLSWNYPNGRGNAFVTYGTTLGTDPGFTIYSWNNTTLTERAHFNNTGLKVTGNIESTTSAYLATSSGSVGIGTITPNASALLDMTSTTKGFLPPRMTGAEAEAIATPADGLMVYANNGNGTTITTTGWWGYDGAAWVKLN